MSLEELIFCLQCGEEIEFSIGDYNYFAQPQYGVTDEKEGKYILFKIFRYKENEQDCLLIFSGTIEELVDFQFDDNFTLKENIEKFSFFDGCYIVED